MKIQAVVFVALFALKFNLCFSNSIHSAVSIQIPPDSIQCNYIYKDVLLQDLNFVSNVLRIVNFSSQEINITVDQAIPEFWKIIGPIQYSINLKGKDSIFIPVRLSPIQKNIVSGFRYKIISIVKVPESFKQIQAMFLIEKPRVHRFSMDLNSPKTLYLKNNEFKITSQVLLENKSDFTESYLFNIDFTGRNIRLLDSAGKFKKQSYIGILKPYTDTLSAISTDFSPDKLTPTRIDPNSYINVENYYYPIRNSIFYKARLLNGFKTDTSKTNFQQSLSYTKHQNVVKLFNRYYVNNSFQNEIPSSLRINFFNLVSRQPIVNILLFGQSRIEKLGYLNYYLQSYLNSYSFNTNTLRSFFGQVNLMNKNYSASFGSNPVLSFSNGNNAMINLNGFGGGIKYNFKYNQEIGVIISRPLLNAVSPRGVNFGVGYQKAFQKASTGIMFQQVYQNSNTSYQILRPNLTLKPNLKNNIMLYYNVLFNKTVLNNNYGFNYNYNWNRQGFTNVSFQYNQSTQYGYITPLNFNYTNDNLNISLRNQFIYKKQSIQVFNSFIQNSYYSVANNKPGYNTTVNNQIIAGRYKLYNKALIPGMYIDYNSIFNIQTISYGSILNFNNWYYNRSLITSFNLRSGYNHFLNYNLPNFFTSQVTSFVSYKLWRFNARYFYGPMNFTNLVNKFNGKIPYEQFVFSNITHQMQFKNKKIVWENNVFYNLLFSVKRHVTGFFSQLYYFTSNGWVFNLNLNYNLNSYQRYVFNYNVNSNYNNVSNEDRVFNNAFQLGFGIRKDFNISLPHSIILKPTHNLKIKTFIDLNSNRKFEPGEPGIENVVVTLGDFQLQTDTAGEATLFRLQDGWYRYSVILLEEIGSWFPILNDSLYHDGTPNFYIPFTRGGEILGKVEVKRDAISEKLTNKIDISGIRVQLTDSSGKTLTTLTDETGNFKFNVPFGDYNLYINDNAFSNDFMLSENHITFNLNTDYPAFYQSFFIIERLRKTKKKKFDQNGNLISE